MGPRLRECFRQAEAQVASNSRNKIHKTRDHFLSNPCTEIGKMAGLFAKLQTGKTRKRINAT